MMLGPAWLLLTAATLPSGWQEYANVRFGYRLCYPPVLRAAPEAPNGDGRAFEGPDGARMIVYGTNNVEDASLPSFADSLARPDERITYRAGRSDWIVRSGMRRDKVFWRKTFASGDQFVTLAIDYPAARRRTYGPIVATISKCFAIGQPAF